MSINFGLGSRDLFSAGRMALKNRSLSGFKTKSDYTDRWRLFCDYADQHGIKKMENITREFVTNYGRHLQTQLEAGVYSSASAPKNYLSAVNCVMKLATHNSWKTVKPGADCGIARREYIPKATKSISETEHLKIQQDIGERIAQLMALQRTFGLRFKESCLLNPKIALKQAEKYGYIKLTCGTKGGRPRRVPCDGHGKSVLISAMSVQDGRSMVPRRFTYIKFRTECYEQSRLHGLCFHSERHAYAQQRYQTLVGAPSPIDANWQRKERIAKLSAYLSISETEANLLDKDARLTISIELGHGRLGVSNAYLG